MIRWSGVQHVDLRAPSRAEGVCLWAMGLTFTDFGIGCDFVSNEGLTCHIVSSRMEVLEVQPVGPDPSV
jgi:hypothetical protein